MTTVRSHSRSRFGGIRTRSLEVDGAGPPIVLLHGFTDSADSWRPVLAELAQRGRRAIAVDLPEAGRAGHLPPGPVGPALDAFVADLVAQEGPGVVLVGNSLGGMLALRAASTLPGIGAVVPIAPAGFGFTRRMERAGRLFAQLGPVLRLYGLVPYPGWLVRDLAARFYALRFGLGQAEPELARRYASHFRGGAADIKRLAAFGRRLSAELLDAPHGRLEEIEVPVLLVWGRRDAVCDIAGASAAEAAIPGATLVVLERSGHLPQLQQPIELAQLLVEAGARATRLHAA